MKFKLFICLFSLLFVFTLPLLSNNSLIATSIQVITDKKFSLEIPSTWEKRQNYQDLDVVALAPLETPDDSFRQNISVISGKTEDAFTLDQFYSGNIENLKASLNDVKVIDSGETTIGGLPAKWIIYTHSLNKIPVQVVQYFIVSNHFAYVITGSSDPKKFSRYAEAFESIAKSFKTID